MSQDYNQSFAFIAALAGDPATAVLDWRALHDRDKTVPGHARRGTLNEWWQWLCEMNSQGYGIFCTIAAMDGVGRNLENVHYLRAHYIDLDGQDAQQQYQRAASSNPAPSFAVQSSPGKFHVYWPVAAYQGNDRFQLMQRKLRQMFNGDKRVIDAARVMRVPGFYHCKGEPVLTSCHALAGYGQSLAVEHLEAAYQAVNVIDGGAGVRHELGDPELAAPSLDWLRYGLQLLDPNSLDRGDWIAMMAAIKQAGWSLADETTLFGMFNEWCSRYDANDPGENLKQWNSIRNTELGWHSFLSRVPGLRGAYSFGGVDRSAALSQAAPAPASGKALTPEAALAAAEAPPALDCNGEYLTHIEQQQWFKGCAFIVHLGKVFDPVHHRFLNPASFNAAYGGKKFIIDSEGKMTNEAWQAATRSTLWTIPKVDHIRFMPSAQFGDIIIDDLGRKGINVCKLSEPARMAGDASPFLWHIAQIVPDAEDQKYLLDYLAHNAKYPGHKIPWAPVIQSVEGAGKGVIKEIMTHAVGATYFYSPSARELGSSGAQFNGWMRNKLFILADEIKVDDRRDMIEVLKPMISEKRIEIQSKGVDQDIEDNFSNWLFFTNYKDAVPVNKNGRRFAIFYSQLQTLNDLLARGMDKTYFDNLYSWLERGGTAIVYDWLMNYPIERGAIPMRAPQTTSAAEAVSVSRSPIERVIDEAVEDGIAGFRGGWVSLLAVTKRLQATNAVRGSVAPHTVQSVLESMGYVCCGRPERAYFPEDQIVRTTLFHIGQRADMSLFGPAQGYE